MPKHPWQLVQKMVSANSHMKVHSHTSHAPLHAWLEHKTTYSGDLTKVYFLHMQDNLPWCNLYNLN